MFYISDGLNVAEVLVKESHAKNKSENRYEILRLFILCQGSWTIIESQAHFLVLNDFVTQKSVPMLIVCISKEVSPPKMSC